MATIRVTRVNTEVAGIDDAVMRVTRVSADVAGVDPGTLRVTRVAADIAGNLATPNLNLIRFAVHVLMSGAAPLDEAASSGLQFTQDTATDEVYGSVQDLIFDQEIAWTSKFQPIVEQSLVFGQDLPDPGITLYGDQESALQFSDEAINSLKSEYAEDNLIFGEQAWTTNPTPYEENPEQSLIFGQVAVSDIKTESASNGLVFSQTIYGQKIVVGGISESANNGLIFTDSVGKVLILGTAIPCSSTQSLIFSEHATVPIFAIAQLNLRFTQIVARDWVHNIEQELKFGDEPSAAGSVWPRTTTQSLVFGHAVVWENTIDTCNYSPNVGESSVPGAPTPPAVTMPTLVKQNHIRLYYPTTITPTLEVIIRAPEFGNRERLEFTRINRESRGGYLEVFADPTWPKVKQLALTFTGLTEAQAQAVLSFFENTLGLQVGLEDWEGRDWHGVITTPNADLVRSQRNIVDLSFEFEGELQ